MLKANYVQLIYLNVYMFSFTKLHLKIIAILFKPQFVNSLNSKVHGTNMGPIWGHLDPGGPHVGPINIAILVTPLCGDLYSGSSTFESATVTFAIRHILFVQRCLQFTWIMYGCDINILGH